MRCMCRYTSSRGNFWRSRDRNKLWESYCSDWHNSCGLRWSYFLFFLFSLAKNVKNLFLYLPVITNWHSRSKMLATSKSARIERVLSHLVPCQQTAPLCGITSSFSNSCSRRTASNDGDIADRNITDTNYHPNPSLLVDRKCNLAGWMVGDENRRSHFHNCFGKQSISMRAVWTISS